MNVALHSQLLILASSTFIFLQLLMKWSRRAGRPIAVYGPPGSNVTLPTWLWKCNDSFHETKSIKNTDIWGAWVVLSFILLHLYQYRSLWNHILFKLHFRTVLLKVFSVVKSIFAPNLVQVHDPNTDICNTDTKYSHWQKPCLLTFSLSLLITYLEHIYTSANLVVAAFAIPLLIG